MNPVSLDFILHLMLLYSPPLNISTQCSGWIVWRLFGSVGYQRQYPVSFVVWFIQAFVSLDQHHLYEKYRKPINHRSFLSAFFCSCVMGSNVFKILPFPLGLHRDQTIIVSSLAVLVGLFPIFCLGIKVVHGADVFNIF